MWCPRLCLGRLEGSGFPGISEGLQPGSATQPAKLLILSSELDRTFFLVHDSRRELLSYHDPDGLVERVGPVIPIDVVVVSWNCRDALIECLKSLRRCQGEFDLRTVVVDNFSSDDTVQAVKSEFPNVKVIANPRNVGFAAGCNQGILAGKEEVVLLINPDCQIDRKALRQLFFCLQIRPEVACVGPSLVRDGKLLRPVYRRRVTVGEFLLKMLFLDHLFRFVARGWAKWAGGLRANKTAVEVDYLVGACILARRAALLAVGLFDPRFHLYFEDQDLCLRLKARGFAVLLCPQATVVHNQGASASKDPARTIFESYRSLCYFFSEHGGRASRLALRVSIVVGAVIRLFVWGLLLKITGKAEAAARIDAYRRVIGELGFGRSCQEELWR